MCTSAPRIPQRLLVAIDRLDHGGRPIADVIRRVGAEAENMGIPRPSYERVRQLVHASRALRRRRGPSMIQVVTEIGVGGRSADGAVEALLTPRRQRL